MQNAYGHGSLTILGMTNGDRGTAGIAKLKIAKLPSGLLAVHVNGGTTTRVRVFDSGESTAYKDRSEVTETLYWVTFDLNETASEVAHTDEELIIWVEGSANVNNLIALEGRPPGGTKAQPVFVGD
jgi:hypothetical protein